MNMTKLQYTSCAKGRAASLVHFIYSGGGGVCVCGGGGGYSVKR